MLNNNPSLSFRHLKRHVSIEQVLQAYGLMASLRKSAGHLYGPCPLHGGDHPTAFRVQLHRGLWHCFTRCGGGDIVDLICRIEGCDLADAARHLLRLAQSVELQQTAPAAPLVSTPRNSPFQPFRRRIALDPRLPFLQQHKVISVKTASHFEAGCTQRSSFLKSMVAVRLHDLEGQPLGYCGRRLDPQQIRRWGKWRFPKGLPKSQLLYNAHRAVSPRPTERTIRSLVVVECPWAVMRLAQAGIAGAVALLGTSLSPVQARWLSDASSHVLLLLDGDQAGRNATKAIMNRLHHRGTVIVHELPKNHEPEDLTDQQLAELVRTRLPFSLNP